MPFFKIDEKSTPPQKAFYTALNQMLLDAGLPQPQTKEEGSVAAHNFISRVLTYAGLAGTDAIGVEIGKICDKYTKHEKAQAVEKFNALMEEFSKLKIRRMDDPENQELIAMIMQMEDLNKEYSYLVPDKEYLRIQTIQKERDIFYRGVLTSRFDRVEPDKKGFKCKDVLGPSHNECVVEALTAVLVNYGIDEKRIGNELLPHWENLYLTDEQFAAKNERIAREARDRAGKAAREAEERSLNLASKQRIEAGKSQPINPYIPKAYEPKDLALKVLGKEKAGPIRAEINYFRAGLDLKKETHEAFAKIMFSDQVIAAAATALGGIPGIVAAGKVMPGNAEKLKEIFAAEPKFLELCRQSPNGILLLAATGEITKQQAADIAATNQPTGSKRTEKMLGAKRNNRIGTAIAGITGVSGESAVRT